MANKIKQNLSLDKDVHKAIQKEADKKRDSMSGIVNKTMAKELKVKL